MSNKFSKSLNLMDAIMLVSGSMIGSGIFIVSADIARSVQSGVLLLAVWLIAGIMTIAGALCYGEYAASIPKAGGQYVYLKKIWGEIPAFLYGWTLFLVIQTGTIAAVSVAFARFLGVLFPHISNSSKLISLAGVSLSTEQIIAIFMLIVLSAINTRGIKTGAILQNIFTITKIIALIAIIACGLFIGMNFETLMSNLNDNNINYSLTPILGMDWMVPFSVVAISLVGALFSSDAWNNVTFIAQEIKKPEKNLPLALLFGTGLVVFLYFLTNIIYLGTLSLTEIQTSLNDIVGASLMEAIFGTYGKIIISVIILISAFGCMNGMIIAGARVYYAMAKDGLFFKKLTKLGKKSQVPENSLIIQCIWASILVLSGNYSQLLDYVIFSALLFYIMTVGGLFKYRKDFPDIERPYKTLFYPYLPIFYCVLASFTAVNLLIYKPVYSGSGLIIVLSGIPVYYIWKKLLKTTNVMGEQKESIE